MAVPPYRDLAYIIRAAQYDGSNAVDILSQFNAERVSESGGVLTYRTVGDPFNTFTANTGDYIHWSSSTDASQSFAIPTLLPFPYVPIPTGSAAPPVVYTDFVVTGSAAIPASALGGTQVIDVTLSGTMSGTNFVPAVFMRVGPSILPSVLSGHGISSAVPLNATTVRVTVRSGLASLAGASLFVVARETRVV